MNDITLVDRHGRPVGSAEKLEVHRDGRLHRAFSTFVFNGNGELLLQRRAPGKYHSGGLWSNTCCGHPTPTEELVTAAERRLDEEMGFSTPLTEAFRFIYRVELDNGLIEHEYDHVCLGRSDVVPRPHPAEVSGWRWVRGEALRADIASSPDSYTAWTRICLDRVLAVQGS